MTWHAEDHFGSKTSFTRSTSVTREAMASSATQPAAAHGQDRSPIRLMAMVEHLSQGEKFIVEALRAVRLSDISALHNGFHEAQVKEPVLFEHDLFSFVFCFAVFFVVFCFAVFCFAVFCFAVFCFAVFCFAAFCFAFNACHHPRTRRTWSWEATKSSERLCGSSQP